MSPKFIARDCELSTTGVGGNGLSIGSWQVARDVLAHIDAVFRDHGSHTWPSAAQSPSNHHRHASPASMDCLRHWAPNGQCYYSDMAHVACTAATQFPRQFAAQCFSTLMVADQARNYAQTRSPDGVRYSLSAANADPLDPAISWGTHLNVSVDPALWDDLLVEHMRPGVFGFAASAIAAAIPFFGAGYLLPLRDGTMVYSLSARAHHLSRLHTLSTTQSYERGLLNSRRQPHGEGHDRLHLIGFDYTLVGAALLCSLMQCVLSAAELGYGGLILQAPVRACRLWSWNLDSASGKFPANVLLIDGRRVSLPSYMRELAEQLLKMCEAGLITPESAPQATEMLPLIIELAGYAEEGSLDQCARHLDWAAKLMYLLAADVDLQSPQARLMDHDFTNTDPSRGALWSLWSEDLINPLIHRDAVEACLADGPEDSRAWGRGRLIQRFGEAITAVDWGYVELGREADRWAPRLRIPMPTLDSFTRQQFESICERVSSVEQLEAILAGQGAGMAVTADPLSQVQQQLATFGGSYRAQ